MGELSSSIAEAIRKRAVSSTLGTYLLFWCAVHWQGIYTTLFTSEDLIFKKYSVLKNEYVSDKFFSLNDWDSLVIGLALPLFATYVFIWLAPHYVLIHAYRQEQKHKVDRRRVKLEEERKLEKEEEKLSKQEIRTLNAKQAQNRKRVQVAKSNPSVLWEEEFKAFKESDDYKTFKDVLTSVYRYRGQVEVYDDYNNLVFDLSPQALRIADVKGLIQTTSSGTIIQLTEKGKFFADKYDLPI